MMEGVKWVLKDTAFYTGVAYRDKYRPIVTLDAIEQWLNLNRRTLSQCASVAHTKWCNEVIDDLLAQVQAAKEKG